MAVFHTTSTSQVFLQEKVLWTSIAHFECSCSSFNQFSLWQTIHDTNEKMSQLTQGMVENGGRYFNLLELCLREHVVSFTHQF